MPRQLQPATWARPVFLGIFVLAICLGSTSCATRVGADKLIPAVAYRQARETVLQDGRPSRETTRVLERFDPNGRFATSPDDTLRLIHREAVASRDRGLLLALSELSYAAGERLRRNVKPWERRDPRDYYLASAVYSWFFLFDGTAHEAEGAFDQRLGRAGDLYNYGLSWALSERHGTNALAVLSGGRRDLPTGRIDLQQVWDGFGWSAAEVDRFLLANEFRVHGLTVHNRQSGLGVPLIAVGKPELSHGLARCAPATAFLRITGTLADLEPGQCRARLELYSTFDTPKLRVDDESVPLEADLTAPLAYSLNQRLLWRVGRMQFFSSRERIPSDVYLTGPYRAGKVPVVFVHGTFSSPVKWAEMANTLGADPELRARYQFWHFIYNSGNPTFLSAVKLREALVKKIQELDPEGRDPALREMVVIGHSQGGLLAKLTATDTGDAILRTVIKTNRLEDLQLNADQQALLRHYACYEALPFVKCVVFISTPHRGSYRASSFVRRWARRIVSLPSWLVATSKDLAGLEKRMDLPRGFRGALTSLDSMSPRNPAQLALAEIPPAPGVTSHSIIAVKGNGDFRRGKDGIVAYQSAHVDYVVSELIVRGPHSCQNLTETIEEVRRILHEHLATTDVGAQRLSGRN